MADDAGVEPVVLDIGYCVSKIGFGGQEKPLEMFPSIRADIDVGLDICLPQTLTIHRMNL